MTSPSVTALVVLALAAAPIAAQGRTVPGMTPSGPLIQSTGLSVAVEGATFRFPDDHVFKAVFEINRADTAGVNEQLTTIARYLNLHARHGVPKERLHAAAVIHGSGWMSLLSDSAHTARFGRANPSKRLVEELLANNVPLVFCGQTAGIRGVKREELLPGVQLGLSAMTALNVFQSQGYRFNPW